MYRCMQRQIDPVQMYYQNKTGFEKKLDFSVAGQRFLETVCGTKEYR